MYEVVFQDGGCFWHSRYEGEDSEEALRAFAQATYDNPHYCVMLRFFRPKNDADLAFEENTKMLIESLNVDS